MESPAFVPATVAPLQDGDMLASIDLGSDSFHMVVARYSLGQLRTVDRVRETVRLAEGLDGQGTLTPEVRQRAFECLARFGQSIRDIPPQRVRAVATNPVRALSAPQADRKSVVEGKRVSVRVDLGGRRIINNKTLKKIRILK